MKKYLILSITFNILIVFFIAAKRYYYAHQSFPAPTSGYNDVRKSIFASLPIDTTDIVFIGNSLTEGFMVNEFFGPHCKNRGVNGNKLTDIINRIDQVITGRPKKIFLEGGINDISAGVEPKDIANHYKYLVETINHKSPHTIIFLQSILPTTKEYNHKKNVFKANTLLKELCQKEKVKFIDLYQGFENDGYLIDSLTYDGIHLNGYGYKIWAEKIRPYL